MTELTSNEGFFPLAADDDAPFALRRNPHPDDQCAYECTTGKFRYGINKSGVIERLRRLADTIENDRSVLLKMDVSTAYAGSDFTAESLCVTWAAKPGSKS